MAATAESKAHLPPPCTSAGPVKARKRLTGSEKIRDRPEKRSEAPGAGLCLG